MKGQFVYEAAVFSLWDKGRTVIADLALLSNDPDSSLGCLLGMSRASHTNRRETNSKPVERSLEENFI
jgi:hypothetical protein